jgi:hypothetical protein
MIVYQFYAEYEPKIWYEQHAYPSQRSIDLIERAYLQKPQKHRTT